MNATVFLVDTLFSLYLMVVILRLWLQMVQADFYNPLSQFVVKATHPIVGPLRRIIPSIGRFDTADAASTPGAPRSRATTASKNCTC